MSEDKGRTEEFSVSGDRLLDKVKELVREGNIRRIAIRDEQGRSIIDLPLTVGVVGTLLAPRLAALGAIVAMVTRGSIVIEKEAG
jgi:hypothetical protein